MARKPVTEHGADRRYDEETFAWVRGFRRKTLTYAGWAILLLGVAVVAWMMEGCALSVPTADGDVVDDPWTMQAAWEPMEPGERITIDTESAESLREWASLIGMQPYLAPAVTWMREQARCQGNVAGLYFDVLSRKGMTLCASPGPISAQGAAGYCEMSFHRRGALFAMQGLMERELPWRLVEHYGGTVVCVVGDGA